MGAPNDLIEKVAEAIWRGNLPASRANEIWPGDALGQSQGLFHGWARNALEGAFAWQKEQDVTLIEVKRRLSEFASPSFDRTIVERLIAIIELGASNLPPKVSNHTGKGKNVLPSPAHSAETLREAKTVKPCAICGGPFDNDALSDICVSCENDAPWREATLAQPNAQDGWAERALTAGGRDG